MPLSNGRSALLYNVNMLFCILVALVSFIFSVDTENHFPSLRPRDILSQVDHSCVVVVDASADQSLLQTFQDLQDTFAAEEDVLVGSADFASFSWPSGDNLQLESDLNVQIVVFPKREIDRSCLLLPVSAAKANPKPVPYAGQVEIGIITSFINTNCGTFRNPDGHLSMAGLHRQDILQNVFRMDNVTNTTMGLLHNSTSNPFSKASQCMADHSMSDHGACSPSSQDSPMYTEHTNQHIPEVAKCEKIKMPLSQDDFFHNYLQRSKPVIIEGAAKNWPAFSKWTHQFFLNNFGKNRVHIKLTPGGDFEGVEKAELWDNYHTFSIPQEVKVKLPYPDLVVVRPAGINMNFSDFLDLITWAAEQPSRNVSAYLEYSSIPEHMPELESDIEEFTFAKHLLKRKHLNIWLSDGNTIGRLHFDPFDNLLCQLRGQKQVLLFEPYDNRRLYEGHIPQATLSYDAAKKQFHRKTLQDSTSMVMSPVDILIPDFQRFPLFGDVKPLNCTIDEGDVLFMPSFWWHEVYSKPNLDEKRNLAVNFWYEPFLKKNFPCPECPLDVNPTYRHLL